MKKLAFEIGVQKVCYVLLEGDTRKKEGNWEGIKNKDTLLSKIAKIIKELGEPGISVRISSPTSVNSKTGYCHGLSGIKGYANFNIYDELSNLVPFDMDLKVINDANAALMGILNTDFNKKPHSAIMISIGTGVGGSLFIDGKIMEGYNYVAGEIGYPIWKGKKNVSQALSPYNRFKKEYKATKGDIFKDYLVDRDITDRINKWAYEMVSFISFYSFCINPEVIVFSGEITKNKTFQMLITSMYEKYLETNYLTGFSKTKIAFIEGDTNYSLEGVIAL